MKKFVLLFSIVCIVLSCVACGEYENFNDAIDGSYSEIQKSNDEEEIFEIFSDLQERYLEDLQAHTFYYRYDNSVRDYGSSGYLEMKYPEKYVFEKEERTIFVKSYNEVYVVPFSKEQLAEKNIDATNIETIENSDIYKYKIDGFEPANKDDEAIKTKVGITIILKSYYVEENYKNCAECYSTVRIMYRPKNYNYWMLGYFADMLGPNDNLTKDENNLSNGFSQSRDYYKSEDEATAANERIVQSKKEFNEKRTAKMLEEVAGEEALAQMDPRPGMTADEVRKTKWGKPDKVNKNTYSWGVTEQWVYEGKGYVYLQDGIVDSVSERN